MPSSRTAGGGGGGGFQRSRSSGGFFPPVVVLLFLSITVPLLFLAVKVARAPHNGDRKGVPNFSSKQTVDWRVQLAMQHLGSDLTKEVIDSISASHHDLGPWSLDFFRTNHVSSSWQIDGVSDAGLINGTTENSIEPASHNGHETSQGKSASDATDGSSLIKNKGLQNNSDGQEIIDTPAKLARRQLREKRREKRAMELVQQDDEALAKLENAAIERSKAVDSAVLGKYSIWRRDIDNENSDSTVRLMRDQMIMARVYSIIAKSKEKLDLYQELQIRLKESQRAVGDANADSDLHRSAPDKIKAMGQVLSRAREQLYDCKAITQRLRAMLQAADEQVRNLKKQSTFLSQLAAKTIPNGIHCLSMRLTIGYYLLPEEKRKFPRSENLENPNLYHYALFSDNVLAASVVVNSTIVNAKEPEKHVFHLVTDKLNFGAMNMWFLLNPPGKATIHVENVDDFKWLNSSYCPVLRQLESAAMKEYYFKADHPTTLSAGSSNLKYRNPKYLSMLNHLRFYLPEVYPKLDKILFLDDDIVVQKDLTGLWSVDLKGKVNGAVETCGESFHRFDKYLNFSNPHIARNFDPNACGWAYGMNIFDLKVWKKKDITGIYHKWQNMAFGISTSEAMELLDKFLAMSPDSNGRVNILNFQNAFGLNLSSLSEKIFRYLDVEKKGAITFRQFVLVSAYIRKQPLFARACDTAFSIINKTETGCITMKQLIDIFPSTVNEEIMCRVFGLMDADNDGAVSREDFSTFLHKNPLLIALFAEILSMEST